MSSDPLNDALAKLESSREGLGDPPAFGASPTDLRAFLTRGYGLPAKYSVSRVVRLGGRAGTGIAVFIKPPGGGDDLRIHYDREADCTNHIKLRAQAAGDTKGVTRSVLINSPKAACAMYEAMCTLADHFEAADLTAQTREWVQQLRLVAATTPGEPDSYAALRRLQAHEYSKRLVKEPPRDRKGNSLRPVPLLLIDSANREYITARHMAVFLNDDLGVEGAGNDDRILSRLTDIGAERIEAREWDSTTRARQRDIELVLYRLPEEPADE